MNLPEPRGETLGADASEPQNGPQGDETGPGDTHIEPTDAPDTDPQPESMPQNVTSAP